MVQFKVEFAENTQSHGYRDVQNVRELCCTRDAGTCDNCNMNNSKLKMGHLLPLKTQANREIVLETANKYGVFL